jgi:hypothetical protein
MADKPVDMRTLLAIGIVLPAMLVFGALFYRMVVSMETITVAVTSMNDEMAAISRDVAAMRESVQKMDAHMEQLGATMGQGAREMQRVNPMRIMEGMNPGAN